MLIIQGDIDIAKKNKEFNFDDVLEKTYWILKTKLHFDDIQSTTTIMSIILLPISFYLGVLNPSEIISQIFYITLGLDILVIIYSFVKIKYFKNTRKKELRAVKELKVKDINVIDTLSGVDFEKFVAEYYKTMGYKTEITQASHDNGVDILATKNNKMLCVEAKRRTKKINKNVVLSVHYGMEHVYKGDKAVIFTNTELTDQARATAKDKNVYYIDRYDIEKFLRNNPNIIINPKD